MNQKNAKDSTSVLSNNAINFYTYLKQLLQIKSPAVRDIQQYIDVLWFNDIPHEAGCYCAGWNYNPEENDNIWLEVKKQILPPYPRVPLNCLEWIDKKSLSDINGVPVLKEKIINPEWEKISLGGEDESSREERQTTEIIQFLELNNYPELKTAWDRYIEQDWNPWAIEFKKKKRIQDIYARLFSMYQQQKSLGESYEVVLGLGFLTWETPSLQSIARHIITAQVDLGFDADKGDIFVRPSVEGAKLQIEEDMLEPDERPVVEIQLNLQERLKQVSNEIWDAGLVQPVIRSWIQALHANAVYSDSWERNGIINESPSAFFAPALILRKRTARGLIGFIDQIISQLSKGVEIPKSVRMFVDICEDKIEDYSQEATEDLNKSLSNFDAEKDQIFFPLPANEEQFQIIKEFKKHLGVLVQGPPGTGKSHTIANLICHLLATGKKVLVTSQTSRALKVLKDKMPKEIAPLTVNLLGHGVEDLQSLEFSVGEITRKYNAWDARKNQQLIKSTQSQLENAKFQLHEIKTALRELRETETYKHSIVDNKYQGTAQEIANRLAQEEVSLGWIEDAVSIETISPATPSELLEFLRLHRKITPERRVELEKVVVPVSQIPTQDQFVKLLSDKILFSKKVEEVNQKVEFRAHIDQFKNIDKKKRENTINNISQFMIAKKEALRRPLSWVGTAVQSILGEQDQPLKELFSTTKMLLEGLNNRVRLADETHLVMPQGIDLVELKAVAEDLRIFLEAGGKLGWAIFKPKVVQKARRIMKEVKVNGRECETIKVLDHLINLIEVRLRLQQLEKAWTNKIDHLSGTYFNQTAEISENLEALEVVLKLEDYKNRAHQSVISLGSVFLPKWQDDDEVLKFFNALEAAKSLDGLQNIEEFIEDLKNKIRTVVSYPDSHPVNAVLLNSIEKEDWRLWGEAYNCLTMIVNDCSDVLKYQNIQDKLRPHLENTLEKFYETGNDQIWETRFKNFDSTWLWSRAESWFNNFSDQFDEYELQNNYIFTTRKISTLEAELAALKAWEYCFQRMTEEQRQHLMAWSASVQKIGKGTGKRAEKHRRDAQEHMEKARSSIPAWVMPLYRVAESFTPSVGMFDVVIIDEASQSGPEALFLLYIAKQCIVVGDDQQIAPEGVGINRENVDLLIRRFLSDIPHADTFGVETSFFTHAQIRFGNRIVLKEHFRCVPEIIQFSNDLCYAPLGTPLVPLRQYPPKRLESIKTHYCRDGFREGFGQNVRNVAEAEELIKQIVECCKDPKYKDRTMGVISLQGYTQAKYIERKLVEVIGPEEIEKRQIICGDAYDFQGDERDVIFLSMVAATNERIGALTKDTDKRRFNVAASRAKDQLWLFHSITTNDLNPNCFRYRLLSYCQSPSRQVLEFDTKIFESKFQRDVYDRIVARGYRVIPEFRVANYRIDLVVEGIKSRLAVECDGDRWHGPEKYEDDMLRQRVLERAGWVFWRVRGSEFYRNPEQALEDLWQVLEEYEIHGAYEKRVEEKSLVERPEGAGLGNQNVAGIEVSFKLDEDEPRLSAALNYSKAMRVIDPSRVDQVYIKEAVITLLKEGSQGIDLIGDKVIRHLEIGCRGRNREKVKRKIVRVINDLKRNGVVSEYVTDKRKRLKLLNYEIF